jgi:hypothetical protein
VIRPGQALAQGAGAPKRLLAFYVPNGFNMSRFWPASAGALDANRLNGTALASLTPFAQQVLVINGLDNHAGSSQGDGPGDHARGTSTFLTCAHPLKHASNLRLGPSVDQVLARHYDGQTRFASLEVGCEGGGGDGACDSGYSCAYSRNISWRDETTPMPKEINPRLLFDRLFGGIDPNATAEARARRLRRRTSVLDFVREDANRLTRRLGVADRNRLDSYLTGVREIETRLIAAENEDQICGPRFERPDSRPNDRAAYARLMLDIIVEAFRCDLTRVSSFMFGNGGSNRAHTEIGVPVGHHELSHHQGDQNRLNTLAQIDAWEVEILAHLLGRLRDTEVDGASLLDNTTVFFGSEIEDGNSHAHYDMPVVLAGRAGGLQTGRYINLRGAQRNNEPLANLYMRILDDAGAGVATFGDDGDRVLDV